MRTTYQIDGMHCQSCVKKVGAALAGLADSAEITLHPPRVVLQGATIADQETLARAVANAGNYTLTLAEDTPAPTAEAAQQSWLTTYYPLLLIGGLISLVSLKGAASWHAWMLHFMAGFFIVFSFFKLLDLQGFKQTYSTYDVLAKRWKGYGTVYPFLELGLGLAFLFEWALVGALWFSMALMVFSSLGVLQALREKRKIRCACLGTVLNLPMSTITLVEDLGMVAMSGFMLAAM